MYRGNTLKFYNFTVHKVHSDVADRKAGDSTGVTAGKSISEKGSALEVISDKADSIDYLFLFVRTINSK